MDNSPLLNAVIEITEEASSKGQFGFVAKVKGRNVETGQTNTYTVNETKKDGSTSIAWTQLQNLVVGDVVQVAFVEKQVVRDRKIYTSRIVRNFNKDVGNGIQNRLAQSGSIGGQRVINPRGEAIRGHSEGSGHEVVSSGSREVYESKEAYGRRLAIHGMVNGLIAAGIPPKEVPKYLPDLVKLENEIEIALMYKNDNPPIDSFDADVELQSELAEDIPF